ncbi:hypothetical protein UPYG_G00082330 [Umbra pygmaea]|uniref:Uncharacterized protein n=1 Tax=Umbra pygmaea TaxID=75934 RepID=A0ABD0XDY1_UMBPY
MEARDRRGVPSIRRETPHRPRRLTNGAGSPRLQVHVAFERKGYSNQPPSLTPRYPCTAQDHRVLLRWMKRAMQQRETQRQRD